MFTTVVLEEAISVVGESFKIFTVTASQLWSQFVPDCHDYWKKKQISRKIYKENFVCGYLCVWQYYDYFDYVWAKCLCCLLEQLHFSVFKIN